MKKHILLLVLTLASSAFAEDKPKEEIDIPINIGLGPAMHWITDQLVPDPTGLLGLKIDIAAIINRDMVDKHKEKIPEQYREAALSINEARIGYLLIPDTIFISPMKNGLSAYGATWEVLKPTIGFGIGISRLSLGIPLRLTYLYLNREARAEKDHFAGIGIGPELGLEIPVSTDFLISFGAGVDYYFSNKTSDDKRIWKIESVHMLFHYRFPFHAKF